MKTTDHPVSPMFEDARLGALSPTEATRLMEEIRKQKAKAREELLMMPEVRTQDEKPAEH